MYSLSQLQSGAARSEFPLLASGKWADLAYLDNAASTQTLGVVMDAMDAYYRGARANIHRGVYDLSAEATRLYEKAHEKVARFVGVDADEVVFTRGTTEGLNLLAYSLSADFGVDDVVVVSEIEHHANFVPWQQLAKERGFGFEVVDADDDGLLEVKAVREVVERVQAGGRQVRVVAVSGMSNATGFVPDLNGIGGVARDAGALLVVDGAQLVAHERVDVSAERFGRPDFLVFSGHKLYGPTGIGVLVGRRELFEEMRPFLYGGDMVREVTREDAKWNELPWKFEAGTPPIAEGIGLGAAVDWLSGLDMDIVRKYEDGLAADLRAKLSDIDGVTLVGPSDDVVLGPIVSFVVDGVHPHDLATLLNNGGVAVRAGHHCAMPLLNRIGEGATTRVSFGLYNRPEDVDRLVEGVSAVAEKFREEASS